MYNFPYGSNGGIMQAEHILQNADIFVTGGAGTLGQALARRRKHEGWRGKFTVYSTDNHKHEKMKKLYPDVTFVQGDIRNPETLYNSMVGHDVCLHLAAVKVIPDAEMWTLDTIDVNINGSFNVCVQARAAGIKHVLGISTDKACSPANAYGSTKHLMEKMFQEFSRSDSDTSYHLIRYGNVLESNGSVIEIWKNSVERNEPIKITNPAMTRFWLSPQQAVDYVIASLGCPPGAIYVPKMKALSIALLAEYTLGEGFEYEIIDLRPGEKFHECLLTIDETRHIQNLDDGYIVFPTTSQMNNKDMTDSYLSNTALQLSKEELLELLKDELPS